MKVINKIRAFFTMKGKQEQMDLASAEIRRSGVYLHPTDDAEHTFFVKADEVEIIIKPGAEITEEDIFVRDRIVNVEPETPAHETTSEEQMQSEPSPRSFDTPTEEAPKRFTPHTPVNEYAVGTGWKTPKKKSFTLMLYPDEHEKLMRLIKDNGYKKVEYILACIEAAKKASMEANYKRFSEDHARRRKEEAQEAKKAHEAENQSKQAATEEVNE